MTNQIHRDVSTTKTASRHLLAAMRLIAGISIDDDSAMACIVDETGHVVARQISAVPLLEGGVWDAAAKRAAIEATLAATRAGFGVSARLDALVVGVSDYHEGVTPPPALDGLAERIAVVQYAEIAHIGALGGKPGIVVVAGAGSIASFSTTDSSPTVR